MLVKKNALDKMINKEGKFTHDFKDCKKIKRKVFPFSLNPGDKPNDV